MTVGTAILCALEDFAAVFGLLCVLRFLFQSELVLTKPRVAIAAVLLLLPAVGGAWFPALTAEYDGVLDFAANALYFVCACLLVRRPRFWALLWKTVLYTFTVEVFWGLIAFYAGQALRKEYAVCTALYLLSGALVWYAASRSHAQTLFRFVSVIPKWTYAVLLLFEVMCYYKAYGERTARFDALFLVASAALLVTVLYLLVRILRLARETNALLQQMALQKEYAESAITDDEALRQFRHDYRNHMLVVGALLDSGNLDEARRYLAAMQEPLQNTMQTIKSGNFVADTILNYKAQSAAQNRTALHFTGSVPAEGIRSDDLCTIFSNLLDNALEACRDGGEEARDIIVEAKTAQGNFLLAITNPTKNEALSDGVRKTTKADRRNHGFGLKNVERAVKRYDGTLQTRVQDGMFCADVLLRLPKQSPAAE